jgi:hypothetical protein
MMFKNDRIRVPIYKRAECLGEDCPEFKGDICESRLELIEATGKSGGIDKGPLVEDCSYALYGQVCMAGEEQIVVGRVAESPNGKGSAAEMIGSSGRTDGKRIVLNTLPSNIYFND